MILFRNWCNTTEVSESEQGVCAGTLIYQIFKEGSATHSDHFQPCYTHISESGRPHEPPHNPHKSSSSSSLLAVFMSCILAGWSGHCRSLVVNLHIPVAARMSLSRPVGVATHTIHDLPAQCVFCLGHSVRGFLHAFQPSVWSRGGDKLISTQFSLYALHPPPTTKK